MPLRCAISRPTSLVIRSCGDRDISFNVLWIFGSGNTLRNGDCSRSTVTALLSVPSKTGSPVVFAKSATSIQSLSVIVLERPRIKNPAITTSAITAAVAAPYLISLLLGGTVSTIVLLPDGTAACAFDDDATIGAVAEAGAALSTPAAETDDLAGTSKRSSLTGRFPDSNSRFSRFKSARISAADWHRNSGSFSNALLMISSSFNGKSGFRRTGDVGNLCRMASK